MGMILVNKVHQRTGFDNTYEMTGHKLPVEEPIVFRQQQRMYVGDTYEEVPYWSVPLWTNPPAVIQIQLQETVNRDQWPHPKPNQGRLREHSRPANRYSDKGHLDRWIWHGGKTMTGDTRPWDPQGKRGTRREESPHSSSEEDLRYAIVRSWDPQGKRGTRREESPHSSGEEDLQNVIDRLGARKGPGRYKTKSQTLGQSRWESCEPYSRRTDPNEHRTRRHKYDADFPPNQGHELVPCEQRDVTRWEEYVAKAVKNPVFPLFVSMAYGSRGLQP